MNLNQTFAIAIFIISIFFLVYSFVPKKVIVTNTEQFLKEWGNKGERTLFLKNGLYLTKEDGEIIIPQNITIVVPKGAGFNGGGSMVLNGRLRLY